MCAKNLLASEKGQKASGQRVVAGRKSTFFLLAIFHSLLASSFSLLASAQNIEYSRQTFPLPYVNALQLVAGVAGNHHVLCFSTNKSPAVKIFDSRLQLRSEKEVNLRLKENCDLRIIAFKDFYYLYVHAIGSDKHDLFRISGEGEIVSLSNNFQLFVEKELGGNKSTLQLINQHENLYVVAHAYYDTIKKMGSTVIQLDKDLNPVVSRKVLYNFDTGSESLQQAMLAGNSLLVLKTSKSDEKGNALNLVKVDLATGSSLINTFSSASHLYSNPGFNYSTKDTSILVYSVLREPFNSEQAQRTVFIVKLNDSLQELAPVTLLRTQFSNNTTANFLLLKGVPSRWVKMTNALRTSRNAATTETPDFGAEGSSAINLGDNTTPSLAYGMSSQPTAVRFTVMSEKLTTLNDSLVANNKNVYDLQPGPFAQFSLNNKAYLLLVQNFTAASRGLVMMSTREDGALESTGIRVFNKYEYLLDQSQSVDNNYVILPYTHRNAIGLVKISIQ